MECQEGKWKFFTSVYFKKRSKNIISDDITFLLYFGSKKKEKKTQTNCRGGGRAGIEDLWKIVSWGWDWGY